MLEYLYPLLIVILLIVGFSTYLLIKVPNAYTFKWVAIPVLLLGAFFSYQIYDRMLGYAYPLPLPETFMFVDYRVVKQDDGSKMIELWVVDQSQRSRLHLVPWSQKSEKQLNEAKQRSGKGIPQVGKKVKKTPGKDGKDGADGNGKDGKGKKKGRDNRSGDWDFDLEFYNLPFQAIVPKD